MLVSLLDGLVASSPLVCLALVYGLLYGVLGLMDLTVPVRFATAGYAASLIANRFSPLSNPVKEPLAIAAGITACVVVTLFLWLLIQPLTKSAPLVTLVGSLGLAGLLRSIYQIAFGASPHIFSGYPAEAGLMILGTATTPLQLVSLAYALVMAACFGFLLYGTTSGKQLLVLSGDPEVAGCVFGIESEKLILRAVIASSVLLAPAGFLYSVGHGVTPSTGSELGLNAFVATIVAGRRRPLAAAVVALGMALLGTAAIRWNLSEWLSAALIGALLTLLWRYLTSRTVHRDGLVSVASLASLVMAGPVATAINAVLPSTLGVAQLPSDFQPLVPYVAVVGALLWRPTGIFALDTRVA
jgi:branched-subunit amino acid ABC-type transport system permease component